MIIPEGSFSFTDFNDTEVEIGKYTAIARECIFHGPDNHLTGVDKRAVSNNLDSSGHSKGKIIIGNDVWIGQGVRILSGVTIGDGAIIGAGAVVAKDVPPYTVAVGNPVQFKRLRFSEDVVKKLLEAKWWDWEPGKVQKFRSEGLFNSIDEFIQHI